MRLFNRTRPKQAHGAAAPFAGRTFRPADSVRTATVDGQTTVLDLRRDRYFGLDEVGTAIWELIRERHTFEQIVDRMEQQYDAPRTQLERDVIQFLTELRNHQLVVET
jgi:hypothetical protein